jgi:hypothetical protein
MAVSFFPAPSAGGGGAAVALNQSARFTASGNWTAPAGVTSAYVTLRGGNGTDGGFYFNGSNRGSQAGADGGSAVAFGVTAVGGQGSRSQLGVTPGSTSTTQAMQPNNPPVEINFFATVVPSTSYSITIGTGGGAYASISWGV